MTDLRTLAIELQIDLAQVDLRYRALSARRDVAELLILQRQNLKVKIYQERGHATPHVHIDYGNKIHAASYRISPIERLAGNLPNVYDREILTWINANQSTLLGLWEKLQAGDNVAALIAELDG